MYHPQYAQRFENVGRRVRTLVHMTWKCGGKTNHRQRDRPFCHYYTIMCVHKSMYILYITHFTCISGRIFRRPCFEYRIQDLQSRRVFGDFPKPAESDKNQYWNLVVLQYQHSNSSSVCGCVANIRTICHLSFFEAKR